MSAFSISYNKIKKYDTWLIVLLCIASRLFQLHGENLFLDGDESIVGLMAKHLFEGKEIPFYFYGQSYGFSFIETFSIAISYFFFGISDFAVKIPMLFLWTTGIIFFYKTLNQLQPGNNRLSFLVTCIFIVAPAWAEWSLKARGGYITSFLLCSVLTWLLFHKEWNKKIISFAAIGFLLIIIYESQPLWLPGLIPLVIFKLYRARNFRYYMSIMVGMLITAILFYLFKQNSSGYWNPDVFNFKNNLINNLLSIPNNIYQNMCGSDEVSAAFHVPAPIIGFAVCFTGIILSMLCGVVYLLVFKRPKTNPLVFLFAISISLTLFYTVFLNGYSPRYLLPLTGFSLLLLFILLQKIKFLLIHKILCVSFISFGVISLLSFKPFNIDNGNKLQLSKLISYLESNNVHHTFSKNGYIQWQLMFYSKENIISRYVFPTDRYPEYVQKVNAAVNDPSVKTALISFHKNDMPGENTISFNDKYFVYINPDKELLKSLGFQF